MSFLDEDFRTFGQRYTSNKMKAGHVGYGAYIRFGREIKTARIAEYDHCSLFCINAPCACCCVAKPLRKVLDLSDPTTRLIPAKTIMLSTPSNQSSPLLDNSYSSWI